MFVLPPAEFTAARNALARRLEAERSERAAEVAALRKPTAPVWIANQLARDDAEAVGALLDATARLASVQRKAARGGEVELREAMAAQRSAIGTLIAAALPLAKDDGALARRAVSTLQAAATGDDELRRQAEAGALRGELGPQGFEALSGAARPAPPPRAPKAAKARKKAAGAPKKQSAAHKRAAERESAAAVRAAERERRAAEEARRKEAAEARRDLARLDREAGHARRAADKSREHAEALRKRADEAARIADEAEADAQRAAGAAAEAADRAQSLEA